MTTCRACATSIDGSEPICVMCSRKALSCRVCGNQFGYNDIAEQLPIVQCPGCEGRAIDVED